MPPIVADACTSALRRVVAMGVAALLMLQLGACAWLDVKQRELALRPTPTRPADVAELQPGDVRFTLPVASASGSMQQLALWWLPQPDPTAPTLLYLHGTFRNLYQNRPKIEALRQAGFAIIAVDYRGWGDSSALVPSEQTIVADAWQAWGELVRRQPNPGRRVIFGHSMGGAVAVTLASGLRSGADYGALIVESTFTSIPELAAASGFWGSIGAAVTTMEFDALGKIARVDAPILMLHGAADQTVPVTLGRRLRDAARPGVRWVEVDGGRHSSLHSQASAIYQGAMKQLIDSLPPASAAALK